eukprot:TRINITY_DN29110_c0_g1_i1.p1 TRINITY_DN29110_c0_g1~~TRINITY_DN29110_c0_g1_i1.p1  ORF type:complete len:239 (+),score=-8.81 TRINITY_DN29110_c0_g1_i1:218-934(+)
MISAVKSYSSGAFSVPVTLGSKNSNDEYYMSAENKAVGDFSKPTSKEIGKSNTSSKTDSKSSSSSQSITGKKELSESEKKVIEALKKRDNEVRSHESAHMAAGAGLVRGAASYSTQVGPDGQAYAIGGEVQIDMAPEKDPQATVNKMRQVQRAALAPAEPSGQDRSVASQAAKVAAEAEAELRDTSSEKSKSAAKSGNNSNKINSGYNSAGADSAGQYIDAIISGSSREALQKISMFA